MKILAACKNLTFRCSLSLGFLLSLGILGGFTNLVRAQTAENIPEELQTVIAEIQAAANSQDLPEVMQYYSPEYSNTDGLTRNSLSQALREMWKDYPRIRYSTTIESWEDNGDELVAETITNISGIQNNQEENSVSSLLCDRASIFKTIN